MNLASLEFCHSQTRATMMMLLLLRWRRKSSKLIFHKHFGIDARNVEGV